MRIDGRTIPDVYSGPDMNVRRDGRIGNYHKVVAASKNQTGDGGSQQSSAYQAGGGSATLSAATASSASTALSFAGSLSSLEQAQTARDSLKNVYTDQTGMVREADKPYGLYDSRAKLRTASAPGSTLNITA